MRAVSRGYLSLRDSDVRFDPWSISLGGGQVLSAPEQLEDWTFYQSTNIRITVVTEIDRIFERLHLDQDASLGVVIVWVSAGTSLRGASKVVPLVMNETSVELQLEGEVLRGDLRLECQIVLTAASGTAVSQLAPIEVGSIVWSTSHVVRLEGVGARMPVLAVPFSGHMAADGNQGLWWLQITSSDLHAPADSVLWMWLNSESPVIQELLSDTGGDAAGRTQLFLKHDFYRKLIGVGLREPDFSLEESYPPGSLGAIIAAPMQLITSDLGELRARFNDDPERVEAEMQSKLGGL